MSETYDIPPYCPQPPQIDWSEGPKLYDRVISWSKDVQDIMLGPLVQVKKSSKTRYLMTWLHGKPKDLVRDLDLDDVDDYNRVLKALQDWARPKTCEYANFESIRNIRQGDSTFTEFETKVRKLVAQMKYDGDHSDRMIKDIIVTGGRSHKAYKEAVKAGSDATLKRVLEIYRDDAAIQSHVNNVSQRKTMNSKAWGSHDNSYHHCLLHINMF